MDRKKKNIVELTHCSVNEYRAMEKRPLRVLADNVRSMHNIGAILRTADAFLIDSVVLGGISGCPPHPEISKTALGAENSVEWMHVDDSFGYVSRMREEGWRVLALEQTHGSVSLPEFKTEEGARYLLVVGNEVEGVDQRIVDICDTALEIPQYGTKHSLNVSCSAAIAMYHLSFICRL